MASEKPSAMVGGDWNDILHSVGLSGWSILVLPLHLCLARDWKEHFSQVRPIYGAFQCEDDKIHDEQFERGMGHYAQATCRGPVPVAAGNHRSAPVVFREKAEKTRLDPVSLWTRSLTKTAARQQTQN